MIRGHLDKLFQECGVECLSVPTPQWDDARKRHPGIGFETPVERGVTLRGDVKRERFGGFQEGMFGVLALQGARQRIILNEFEKP